MTEIRCWLVEREYTDRGLVVLAYATPDGERAVRREMSATVAGDVTAARDVDAEQLEPVTDPDERERYAAEASRMADRHDPEDVI